MLVGQRQRVELSGHERLDHDIVARPAVQHIDAAAADQDVIAEAAEDDVVAAAADQDVVAVTAVQRQLRAIGADARGLDHVRAAETIDHHPVVGEFEVLDHDPAGEAVDHQRAVLVDRQQDDVVAVGPVDGDHVGSSVARGAADRGGEIDVDLDTSVPVRSLTTMLSVPPSALKSMLSTSFRSMVMLARSREEDRTRRRSPRPSMISLPVRAVEQHRVGAVLAFDDVAAVARIPLEGVVAGAEEGDVVALLAVDEVVAVAAEQSVDAVAAENGVVAAAAVDRDLDQRREIAGGARTSRCRRSC